MLPILSSFFVIASMHYIESLEGSGILTRYVILLKLVCGIIIPLLLPPKDTYGAIKKNYGRRTHQGMPDVRNVFIVNELCKKKTDYNKPPILQVSAKKVEAIAY